MVNGYLRFNYLLIQQTNLILTLELEMKDIE